MASRVLIRNPGGDDDAVVATETAGDAGTDVVILTHSVAFSYDRDLVEVDGGRNHAITDLDALERAFLRVRSAED